MGTDRPIFLVGCPRSGTTLLSTIMHAHPRIAMPPETRILLPVYRNRARFGDLAVLENRRRLARRITNPRRGGFRDLGLNRRHVIDAILAAPPTLGSALETLWREFARSRGKQRWGEKRPLYSRYVDIVLRLFPDAQIIHLMRDGRACVASLRRVPWWNGSVAAATAIWSLAEHDMQRNRARLPASTFHTLRYEDLLREPENTLRALCVFLDEEFAPAMLDHTRAARDIVPPRKSWHAGTRRGLDAQRAESWADTLTPAQIGLVQHVAGRELLRNGYALDPDAPTMPLRAVLEFHRERLRRAGAHRKRQWEDWLQRRRDTQPLASALPVADRSPSRFG